MKTIVINTRKSAAIKEWARKESGSFEDSNCSPDHPHAILNRFGGKITLTEQEARNLVESGEYHATGWNEDEIRGGRQTMDKIASITSLLKKELESL